MTSAAAARLSFPARKARRAQEKRRRGRLMAWAKVAYDQLIDKLGAVCWRCGATRETAMGPMSIDHPDGVTWDVRALRFDARVRRYWEEYNNGVKLKVACMPCNCSDANNHRGENRRY